MDNVIKYDLFRLTKKKYSFAYFLYALFTKRTFRIVYYYRKANKSCLRFFYRKLFYRLSNKMTIEIPHTVKIGKGLALGHYSSIVINQRAVLGDDVTLSHGVTIGSVRSGKRAGAPTIGNQVYIAANATIVGGVKIGNRVLIAANSFVDFDVPDDSLVLGNPGVIKRKENPVKDYFNFKDSI